MYGGWANHLGYWHEPPPRVWRFHAARSGPFRVRFALIAGSDSGNVVLQCPLAIQVAGTGKSGVDSVLAARSIESPQVMLDVLVHTDHDAFGLAITSIDLSARLIDHIEVERVLIEPLLR